MRNADAISDLDLAPSVRLLDRLRDHERAGAEIIASYDVSCLMHLEGLSRRQKRPLRVMHVAEVLDEASA